VSSGRTLAALSGGVASGATISSGGAEIVSADGNSSATVVRAGGAETVFGTDSGAILSGGAETVSAGGIARATTVRSGGTLTSLSGGVASGATISSGSVEIVSAGGVADGTKVAAGGSESVFGTESGAAITGLLSVLGGGSVSGSTISTGGLLILSSGGAADNTTLLKGGTLELLSGATDTNLTWSGGTIEAGSGMLLALAVGSGRSVTLLSGALAIGNTISSGGSEVTSFGGIASGLVTLKGGSLTVLGADISAVLSGGSETVSSGGTASATTVDSGGTLTILAGGVASGATISSGGKEIVSSGGTARAVTILSGGTATVRGSDVGATLSGTETVSSGGAASAATVASGGTLTILAGGAASGATISSGGKETISSGGTASGATILSGGAATLRGSDVGATVSGSETVSSGGAASATTVASGGTLSVLSGGAASGTTIDGGTLGVSAGGLLSGSIAFSGSGGELIVPSSLIPPGTIYGFEPGDTFDLINVTFDSAGTADLVSSGDTANHLQVAEGGSTYTFNLDPAQDFTGEYFHLAGDGHSGTLVTEDGIACYCRGTRIRTDGGELTIEALRVGDVVATVSGEARPIRWIGRRAYDGRFIAGKRDALPIRVAAGALADGVPARDLWLSPGHSLYLDGALTQAVHLVNGATIVQEEAVERVEYFHIELDTHDLIYAEGALSETYVDCDNRMTFANGAEYARLYPGDERPRWASCRPRLEWDAEELTAIRMALLARAVVLGHAFDIDSGLHLMADNRAVAPQIIRAGLYRFSVGAAAADVWLASRSTVPAEVVAESRDMRRLGVPIEKITLYNDDLLIEARHDHAGFIESFHDDEDGHRWTNGRARLPQVLLRPFAAEFTLEVHCPPSALRYRVPSTDDLAAA
jgi:autotransporter passenger strand-loop-strand repeat protein